MHEQQEYFTTRPDVRFRIIGGEGVIIRQDAGQAIVVNEIGARILTLLRDGLATAEIIERLGDEYEIGDAEIEEHVADYLSALRSAGVIDPVPA